MRCVKSTNSNNPGQTKILYTDSLEPKDSTQKLIMMHFKNQNSKKGSSSSKYKFNEGADATSSFVVLKTDNDESVYLKTEVEPN